MTFCGLGFGVWSSGFRVQGPGCRVQGLGSRVQGAGFRVQGSGFRVHGSGFRVHRRRWGVVDPPGCAGDGGVTAASPLPLCGVYEVGGNRKYLGGVCADASQTTL